MHAYIAVALRYALDVFKNTDILKKKWPTVGNGHLTLLLYLEHC